MGILKGKQKDFCDYLLQDPEQNATAAYMKAYPGCSSNDVAHSAASRLLASVKVQEYIEAFKEGRSERTRIDADWLLKRLADEAEADVSRLFDESGNLLPVRSWPKIFRKGLVCGIDVTTIGDGMTVTKIKLADRNAKLKMIGDHIGVQAFKQILQHGGDPNNPLRVESTINVEGLSSAALEELANLSRK